MKGDFVERFSANAGLTDGEAAIMDLWDGGERDFPTIAAKTGYGATYVRNVVRRYSVNERVLDAFGKMTAAGSASLLRALHEFHPETRKGVHP